MGGGLSLISGIENRIGHEIWLRIGQKMSHALTQRSNGARPIRVAGLRANA